MDGVNRFIANLAGTFKLLGHEVFILSWSHRGAAEELSRWFKTVHGLGVEVDVAALRAPEDRDRWLTMLFDWFTKGSIRSQYSGVNDLTLVDAEPRRLSGAQVLPRSIRACHEKTHKAEPTESFSTPSS